MPDKKETPLEKHMRITQRNEGEQVRFGDLLSMERSGLVVVTEAKPAKKSK